MHLEANGAGGALAALTALASAGSNLEVAITELDIKNASSNDYTTVLRACLQIRQCVGITSWGISDAVCAILWLIRLLIPRRIPGARVTPPFSGTAAISPRLLTTLLFLLWPRRMSWSMSWVLESGSKLTRAVREKKI